jgi:multidrug efflux pump subunit AcrB
MGKFMQIRDAMVFAIVPPAVPELGTSSGFDFQLQDIGGVGHEALVAARNQVLGMAAQDPALAGVRPNGQDDTPQLKIDIDQAKAGAMGLTTADINAALSAAWGGSVRQRLHRPRPGQEGLCPGRRALPHAPEDLNRLVRPHQQRHDGAVLVLRHHPLDLRLAAS